MTLNLDDLDQLNVKLQHLACTRVVGIDGYKVAGHLGDSELCDLPIRNTILKPHTDGRLQIIRQIVIWDRHDELLIVRPKRFIGLKSHSSALTHRHPLYGIIESRNDQSAAKLDFHWIMFDRGIE